MAVSQAARFSFAPKQSHELALIRIGQYLGVNLDEPVRTVVTSTGNIQC